MSESALAGFTGFRFRLIPKCPTVSGTLARGGGIRRAHRAVARLLGFLRVHLSRIRSHSAAGVDVHRDAFAHTYGYGDAYPNGNLIYISRSDPERFFTR